MDYEYPVICPIINKEVEMDICFDTCGFINHWNPERFVSEEIRAVKGYTDICKNCKYHRTD